ncbi:MAG TPA: NADPH-dependent FMN reductase [Thermoanaerobaculia bacterium]|jgi:NAD(P)H-dependent FMN reductase
MSPLLRILLLSGSTREPSYTSVLTRAVQRALHRQGVETTFWNLRESTLPIADPAFHNDPRNHPDEVVRSLVTVAEASDGFVLASPIYHNSYSGVLKNALDHLTIAQFRYKPVGLASHGGNRSSQAVDHLRIVVRGLLGVAIPAQVCTAAADYHTSENEPVLGSEEILQRVERFALELLVFAQTFRALRDGG